MKRISAAWMVFMVALVIASVGASVAEAQNAGPSDQEVQDMARGMGMDPGLCNDLQNRINEVVAISDSSLSDDEKMTKLTEAVAQSMADMQKAASKDPEVESAIGQHLVLVQALMAAARTSASGNDKKVSDSVKDDLEKLKIITKNYVQMMKLMCPKLTLPDVMNK